MSPERSPRERAEFANGQAMAYLAAGSLVRDVIEVLRGDLEPRALVALGALERVLDGAAKEWDSLAEARRALVDDVEPVPPMHHDPSRPTTLCDAEHLVPPDEREPTS